MNTYVLMNTRNAWSIVTRECVRRSVQLESKFEQHAGLLLWPFSLLAVAGLFFHWPSLSAEPMHRLMRSAPLTAGVIWAFLPLLLGFCNRTSKAPDTARPRRWPALNPLPGLQRLLICALGGFLALFVIAVVRHNLSGCVASLQTSLLLLVSLHETLHAEEGLRSSARSGRTQRPGWGSLSNGGLLRFAGSTLLLGWGLLQFGALLG